MNNNDLKIGTKEQPNSKDVLAPENEAKPIEVPVVTPTTSASETGNLPSASQAEPTATQPSERPSEWDLFFSGKGGSPEKFIRKMEKVLDLDPDTGRLKALEPRTFKNGVRVAWESQSNLARLRNLMLAAHQSIILSDQILAFGKNALIFSPMGTNHDHGEPRQLIADLCAALIFKDDKRRLEFVQLALTWLWCKKAITDQQVIDILNMQLMHGKESKLDNTKNPIKVLINAGCNQKMWLMHLEIARVWHCETTENKKAFEKINKEMEGIKAELADKRRRLESSEIEISRLVEVLDVEVKNAAKNQAKLNQELNSVRNGYEYDMDKVNSRIKGFLSGKLYRLISNAAEASEEPPDVEVIREKLADAMKLLDEEVNNV